MFRPFFTILIFIISTVLHGQDLSSISGKTFIGKRLEYLKFLNDSTLYSSINSYTDTAKFYLQDDTLFVKQRYLQTDQTGTKWMDKIYSYKIVQLTSDTISLKNNYNYSNPRDTFFFVNIDNLKEATSDFKFLRLQYSSPWSGTKQITIDSLGKVTFADNPLMYSVNNPGADKNAKPKNISGQLTQKEFQGFKGLLANSLPLRLPLKRGCPMDGATSDFEIIIGTKRIKSTGCNLSWTHAFLLNYLYDIDKNKGLVKLER
ncbi:MAG: hypothetical protein QM725_04610 [Lacibacter sp.]